MDVNILKATIEQMTALGKGILAADESNPTIAKRFASIQVESTEENRRAYRELLFTTPELNQFISGVILFEETLYQKTLSGMLFPEFLQKVGILPGIKVDKGLVDLVNTKGEKMTQGLDGLAVRLKEYSTKGVRFAKWRAIFTISDATPSKILMKTNANNLAQYAAICQSHNIVPIVEPEVLIDGEHSIEKAARVSEKVLSAVFRALYKYHVSLEHMILKPSMITPGKNSVQTVTKEAIAKWTIKIFRRTVPAAVPTINFLSGGQSPIEATENLNAINQLGPHPWNLSLSYGRALQEPCLKAWSGKENNFQTAQAALLHRAKCNSAACLGKYTANMDEKK